jgi:hypothetical protein
MKDPTPTRSRPEETGVPSYLDHSSLLFRKVDWGSAAIETIAACANFRGPRSAPSSSPVGIFLALNPSASGKIERCRPRGREGRYLESNSKALFSAM